MKAFVPPSSSALTERLRKIAARQISPEVFAILRSYNATLPTSTARERNLNALAQGKACAIVTGQQAGLFLGPLFTYYKAISAIALAKHFEQVTGVRSVPVFWLQIEDHDAAEIATTHLLTRSGEQRELSVVSEKLKSSRQPVADVLVPDEIASALALVAEEYGQYPTAPALLEKLRAYYRTENSFGHAFALLLAELFADDGLILVNPRSPELASHFAPIFSRALREHQEITQLLTKRTSELSRDGYSELIHLRENSPLFFVHEESGQRYRIERSDQGWKFVGSDTVLSDSALNELVGRAPQQLSSSALLRPILQDSILPTACYIGGAAELSYLEQARPLAKHFSLPDPLIIPRAHFVCIDEKQHRWLHQLGLSTEDLEKDDVLLSLKGPARDALALRDAAQIKIEEALSPIKALIEQTDTTLLRPFEKTRHNITTSMQTLSDKLVAAVANRDTVSREHLEKLQTALCPNGVAQERHYAAIQYVLRYGNIEFKSKLLQRFVPFSDTMLEVEL